MACSCVTGRRAQLHSRGGRAAPRRAAPLRCWCLQAINAALAEQDKQVEDIHEQNEHAARRLKELRRHKAFTR